MQPATGVLSINDLLSVGPQHQNLDTGQYDATAMIAAIFCWGEHTCTNGGQDLGKKWVQGPAHENGTDHGQDHKPNCSHNDVGHLLVLLKAEVSA